MNGLSLEPAFFLPSSDTGMDMSALKPLNSSNTMSSHTLRNHVEHAIRSYFANLEGEPASEVYNMVLAEVELPLLEVVLEYTRGNQTRASEILGLNRGTLRKKLKEHGLM